MGQMQLRLEGQELLVLHGLLQALHITSHTNHVILNLRVPLVLGFIFFFF